MKLNKINPNYIFAGVVLLAVVGYYSMSNVSKVDNALLPVASEQEEATEEDTTPVVEEKKTIPVAPASTHVNCATNDWDCFAKAATDGNTATLNILQERFIVPFVFEIVDIFSRFEITNITDRDGVTLSEVKTKVHLYRLEEYTNDEIEFVKSFIETFAEGFEEDFDKESFELPEVTKEQYQERNRYWQSQIGLIKISTFRLDSFLDYINQWKTESWSWSSEGGPGQPYKVIRDDYTDWMLNW